MKAKFLLFTITVFATKAFAQSDSKKSEEPIFYNYTYGASLGYYFIKGIGVNFNAQYNFNKNFSLGGMVYLAKPDPLFYNYLGQSEFVSYYLNNPEVTVDKYSMSSKGALLRAEFNAINSKIVTLYGATGIGLGYSSYSLIYTYVYDSGWGWVTYAQGEQSQMGIHLNYLVDLGLKIHINKNLDLFGEMGIGTALIKCGILWNQ